jgi:hypothetical protein
MTSEHEATKILNDGPVKYTAEEVRQIRDLLVALATIEYEDFQRWKTKNDERENKKIHEPRKAA